MKINFLLIAFLTVSTTLSISCSKDNTDDNELTVANSTKIIGTWEAQSERSVAYETKNGNRTLTHDEHTDYTKETIKPTITFNANKTVTIRHGEDSSTGTYEINGNNIKVNIEEDSNVDLTDTYTEEITMSLEGDKLTLIIKYAETYEGVFYEDTTTIILIKK